MRMLSSLCECDVKKLESRLLSTTRACLDWFVTSRGHIKTLAQHRAQTTERVKIEQAKPTQTLRQFNIISPFTTITAPRWERYVLDEVNVF